MHMQIRGNETFPIKSFCTLAKFEQQGIKQSDVIVTQLTLAENMTGQHKVTPAFKLLRTKNSMKGGNGIQDDPIFELISSKGRKPGKNFVRYTSNSRRYNH